MMNSARYWIEKLQLQKHPEGGWFKEVYRSADVVPQSGLPANFNGDRNFSTSIYFLLEKEEISILHRIKSDELWHYYTGTSAVEILTIKNGKLRKQLVGPAIEKGEQFQSWIPKNRWFGAKLINKNGYALVGCTVSPGFHFDDFELADKKLLKKYPELAAQITPFIR